MIRRILFDEKSGLRVFLRTGAGAGSLLFAAAVLACIFANTALSGAYEHFLHIPIAIKVGAFGLEKSLSHWINDGLMAVFFLLVGLEIKREMTTGELSSVRLALLPAVAAVGGMIAPALIFWGMNAGDEVALRAWAVPVATDIAFSLGVLSLLGSRVPLQVKVFLTAVAVIDDLLAIVVIAVFYSAEIDLAYLAGCFVILAIQIGLNRRGIASRTPYLLLGLVMWVFMLKSGVHATLAGVATAMTIPHSRHHGGAESPLVRLEHTLHNPVTYLILPLFAFANAGVHLADGALDALTGPLSLGIVLGLVVGKPIGICGAVLLAVRTGLCRLPGNTDWLMLVSVSLLCGIGFTVSLFIGELAFATGLDPGIVAELSNEVKMGVLSGSLVAGILGYLVMWKVIRRPVAAA